MLDYASSSRLTIIKISYVFVRQLVMFKKKLISYTWYTQ